MVTGHPKFSGVQIVECEQATALPSAQPRTDDMRAMVDHLIRLGEVERRPAFFRTPTGFVVHPAIMRKLRQRLSSEVDAIAFNAFAGGSLR